MEMHSRQQLNEGYKAVEQLLLEKGAHVNAKGGKYGNAPHGASSGCYPTIAGLLMPNWAYDYGAIAILLLEKGANVNEQGGEYGNALQAACNGGHEGIYKRLLEKGIDGNGMG